MRPRKARRLSLDSDRQDGPLCSLVEYADIPSLTLGQSMNHTVTIYHMTRQPAFGSRALEVASLVGAALGAAVKETICCSKPCVFCASCHNGAEVEMLKELTDKT